MRSPRCRVCSHLDIEEIDRRLLANEKPTAIVTWLEGRRPGDSLNKFQIGKHRRWHLQPERVQPPPPPPEKPKPPASAKLGRDVTDEDIEQRLKRRFYDAIDSIPPEKVAELMIEREKAKARAAALPKPAAPKVPTEDEVSPEIADMRAAAAAALGPHRSRTGLRAVR